MARVSERAMLPIERSAAELVAGAVTALFVPGDRPDRYAKAAAAGADLVIVDLEDAVTPGARPAALTAVVAALDPDGPGPAGGSREPGGPHFRALVRINGAHAPSHRTELDTLAAVAGQAGHGLLGIMLAKAEDPGNVSAIAERLARAAGAPLGLIPLVESARGVLAAPDLARVPGVTRLAFGALDLALDIDALDSGPTVAAARAQVVLASRAARIAGPLDTPSLAIDDQAEVVAAALRARAAGCTGQLCIHPRQIESVREAFRPTPEQIRWARRVAAAGDAAVQLDGMMIDRPVTERARRILARAGETVDHPTVIPPGSIFD